MNKLPASTRAQILRCLVEGNSMLATARLTDTSKNTVKKLLIDAGRACAAYQDAMLRDLPCKRVQMDEIWSFTYAKQRNVATAKKAPEGAGVGLGRRSALTPSSPFHGWLATATPNTRTPSCMTFTSAWPGAFSSPAMA